MAQQRFSAPPTWPQPPDGWIPPPGWQPDPSWGPPPPGWQFWVPEPQAAPDRCRACGSPGAGAYCSTCGAPRASTEGAYAQVVESFLKLRALRDFGTLYAHLLRSPSRNTIAAAQALTLPRAVRFLEVSVSIYVLAIAVSGVPVFGNDEFVKTIAQSVWLLATLTLTYTFFYLAMRRRAGATRSREQYVLFACLTLGYTLPLQAPTMLGPWGALFALLTVVPLYVYLLRTWRWFWWASGTRVLLTLIGCALAGGLLGLLLLTPVWWATGVTIDGL